MTADASPPVVAKVPSMPPGPAEAVFPFRSLDFFRRADASKFAGREEEIEEVATRITAGTTLVVYGPSGVGKTSLLCAGVVPTLEKERKYKTVYVRPLRSPVDDVRDAVGAQPGESLQTAILRLAATGATRAEGEKEVAVHAPIVLLVDQLEELFTRFDEAERQLFWRSLIDVLDDERVPLRLVLSLREDYLHYLDDAHPRLANLLDRRFRLRGLLPFGARTAIVRPLQAAKVRYQPELIDRFITELTETVPGRPEDEGIVDPLLLQIVCSDVFRHAKLRGEEPLTLTLADYDASGGATGVFRRYLVDLFRQVDVEDQLLLALVLQEMTTAHATKRPATVTRLRESGLKATEEEIGSLLGKLVRANLVREYPSDKEPWFELVHDRLVKALPELFARDQRFLRIRFMREVVRQLARGASGGVGGGVLLLSERQLADWVEPYRRYIQFNREELSLLFQSAVAAEHEVESWHADYESQVPGGTPALLLDMAERDGARRAVSAAMAKLKVTDPAVRARCLEIALSDPDADTRDAAAAALVIIGGEEELAGLRAALLSREQRSSALRLLSAVYRSETFLTRIGRTDVEIARKQRESALLKKAAGDIRARGGDGLSEGARLGIVTGILSALLFLLLIQWISPFERAVTGGWGALAVMVVNPLLGAVFGRAAARALERRRVLEEPLSWIGTLLDPRTAAQVVTLFALPTLIAAIWSEAGRQDVVNSALAGAGACAIVAASLALASRTIGDAPVPAWRTRAWAVLCGSSIPWLVAFAAGWHMLRAHPEDTSITALAFIGGTLCAAVGSGMIAAIAGALRGWSRPADKAPRPALWPVTAAISALFAALVAWVVVNNPLSPWAPVLDVTTPSSPPPSNGSTSIFGGRWVRIRNTGDGPRLLSFVRTDDELHSQLAFSIAWPGTHARWFGTPPTSMEVQQPYREIPTEGLQVKPAAGTFTRVPLTVISSSAHAGKELGAMLTTGPMDSLVAHLVACRHRTGARTECNESYGVGACALNVPVASRPPFVRAGLLYVSCYPFIPSVEDGDGEAIIAFDDPVTVTSLLRAVTPPYSPAVPADPTSAP